MKIKEIKYGYSFKAESNKDNKVLGRLLSEMSKAKRLHFDNYAIIQNKKHLNEKKH